MRDIRIAYRNRNKYQELLSAKFAYEHLIIRYHGTEDQSEQAELAAAKERYHALLQKCGFEDTL